MVDQSVSLVRAAALRSRALSLANSCSIGFRSGAVGPTLHAPEHPSGAFAFAGSGLAELQDPRQEDDLRRLRSVDRRAAPEGVCQRYIMNSRITASGISCGAVAPVGPAAAGSSNLHRCNRAHSMAAAALRP